VHRRQNLRSVSNNPSSFQYDFSKFQQATGPYRVETLLFLPAKSRAALNDLGRFIDAKLAQLKQSSAIETEWFRQAQYLKWFKQNKFVPDDLWEQAQI
jgi:hypothetical protein